VTLRRRAVATLSALALSGALVACGTDDVADVQDEPVAPGTGEEGAPDGPLTDQDTPGPEEDVPVPERTE
jgi:hypothetical protein